MSNKNGAIVWKDTAKNISFVLTGLERASSNVKTGGMIQSYVMRNDMNPNEAIKTGKDESICGNCPLRGDGTGKDRSCYVTMIHGPGSVYRGMDNYSGNLEDIKGKPLRLGSYGDTAFVPISVLNKLVKLASKITGYSHQFRNKSKQAYKKFLMASVETLAGKKEANKLGWRTFRIINNVKDLQEDEVLCPASKEMGHKLTCERCGMCNGNLTGRKKNIAIVGHGSPVSAGRNIKKYITSVS